MTNDKIDDGSFVRPKVDYVEVLRALASHEKNAAGYYAVAFDDVAHAAIIAGAEALERGVESRSVLKRLAVQTGTCPTCGKDQPSTPTREQVAAAIETNLLAGRDFDGIAKAVLALWEGR